MSDSSEKPTRTSSTNTKADAVLNMFDQISEDVLKSVQAKIDRRVAAKVKHLEEKIESARPVYIKQGDFESPPVDGVRHRNFETLLRIVSTRQPVMLVGPAGTGKSHAAEQVALLLDTPFYAMSVGAQTSKSDLIGYMDAMKNYVSTPFRKAYEEGGLFLLDEIDAGNSNVLIQLNAALANGYMSFPDVMVRRHENFRFIASANTFGQGANRQYVGRNQLDAATLDRFVFLQWDIDDSVEEHLAVGKYGEAWLAVVRMVRDYTTERELRVVVSPRATQRGSRLLNADIDFNDVLHMALLSQFAQSEKEELHISCHTLFRDKKAEIDSRESKEDSGEQEIVADSSDSGRNDGIDGAHGAGSPGGFSVRARLNNLRALLDSCANLDEAYKVLFLEALANSEDDSSHYDTAKTVVATIDNTTKWVTLRSILEEPENSNNVKGIRAHVVRVLREQGWNFIQFMVDDLNAENFNFKEVDESITE